MAWYKTGTVSVIAGATSVSGVGTKFASNARVGDGFRGPDGEWYELVNIASETVLGIYPAYAGATVSNSANYMIAPLQGYNKESADRLRAITDGIDDISGDVAAAQAAAAAAHESELAAAESEVNSKTSETNSKESELNAKASEINSKASEVSAGADATAANNSKIAASVSEVAAKASEDAAKLSEDEANLSKLAAKASEDAAKISETNSKASENTAKTSETNSKTSETNSAVSATSANTDATTATNAKNDAVSAKTAAEQARDDAIAAAGSVTGVVKDRGSLDLSSGVYPAKPVDSSFWKITVGGTATDGGVSITYGIGDTLMFSKPINEFYKIDNTESVSSVAGKTGVVVLDKNDVGLGNVDNTSDANKPVSTATSTELGLKVPKSDIVDNLTSTDATKVLSAKQGKALYDLLQANNATIVRYVYNIAQGQSVITGTDITGKSLSYVPGGVMLVNMAGVDIWIGDDYTATNGTSLTLVTPAEVASQVSISVFGSFSVADHYTKAEDDVLLNNRYTKAEANGLFLSFAAARGYMEGFRMVYISGTSISVTAGAAYVVGLGKVLTMTSDKVFSGLSGLVVSGTQHFYLYDNAGTPDIEISTVVPVKYYGTSYQKTGDATRRYIGTFLTNSGGVIFQFRHDPSLGRIRFQTPTASAAPFLLVNGAASTTAVLYTGATAPSGASTLAPRGPTMMFHTSLSMNTGALFSTAAGDLPYTPTNADWESYVTTSGSGTFPYDVPVGQNGSGNGGFWFAGNNIAVTAYCRGYTYER